ncbi:MAG: NAD(P)-dependent oxidoreductase [Polynucleobacter sp.]|nr:NAD(P)-dependent oxidoreductase [Polynucleobacter sp.]MDZ4056689.1 NAD(P)-dependent oxidoreductase [Polynucleobacter sp.]
MAMKIGFIGTGIMGKSMASHLMAGGHSVQIYNRSRDKAEELLARGATWFETPASLAAASDVIITIIGYPKDVEAIYLGPDGILQNAKKGCITIDMTTSSPELAKQIAVIGQERGIACLDAPVSGGDIGARDAALSIMVGGDASAYECVLPLFRLMGKTIALLGPAGAGQHTKLCNQIVIASTIMGVCEGLIYAKTAGLDPLAVLDVIGAGAAGGVQLKVQGPRMIKGDFAPGFMLEHFVKDIGLAIAEADRMGLKLPGLAQAKKLYDILMQQGHERTGYHALFELYLRKEVT